jgi:hypothetical protein
MGTVKMQRRDFLTSTAALGLSLAASSVADAFSQKAQGTALAQGSKLTPPDKDLIPVAFAISRNTTWIDFVGPQAVFQTWHFDSVSKRPAPKFKLFMDILSRHELENKWRENKWRFLP